MIQEEIKKQWHKFIKAIQELYFNWKLFCHLCSAY